MCKERHLAIFHYHIRKLFKFLFIQFLPLILLYQNMLNIKNDYVILEVISG